MVGMHTHQVQNTGQNVEFLDLGNVDNRAEILTYFIFYRKFSSVIYQTCAV